jgi:hypothetical protein
VDRELARSTVDHCQEGAACSSELCRAADSGRYISPWECLEEENVVGNLTVTGVGRLGDRVKPTTSSNGGGETSFEDETMWE